MTSCRVAVVGAGVIGLSTAYCLIQEFETSHTNFCITIFADKVLEGTVSTGAGGCFRPDPHLGNDIQDNIKWAKLSFDHFCQIAKSVEAKAAGVFFAPGFHVSSRSSFSLDQIKDLIPDVQPLTAGQISVFLPQKYKFGYRYTTVIVDPKCYLKWLMAKVMQKSSLVIRKVDSLDTDPSLTEYDVIVNCSGLGSRAIAGDKQLIAIRGQTIRMRAPWIKHFVWADGVYIYPKSDGSVTCGGIKQFGRETTDVDPDDEQWIRKRCTELAPSLRDAEVIEHWVGLRPFRQTIRVELEVTKSGRSVVHNYGHGGNGYTYSYGTALSAAKLMSEFLQQRIGQKAKL